MAIPSRVMVGQIERWHVTTFAPSSKQRPHNFRRANARRGRERGDSAIRAIVIVASRWTEIAIKCTTSWTAQYAQIEGRDRLSTGELRPAAEQRQIVQGS